MKPRMGYGPWELRLGSLTAPSAPAARARACPFSTSPHATVQVHRFRESVSKLSPAWAITASGTCLNLRTTPHRSPDDVEDDSIWCDADDSLEHSVRCFPLRMAAGMATPPLNASALRPVAWMSRAPFVWASSHALRSTLCGPDFGDYNFCRCWSNWSVGPMLTDIGPNSGCSWQLCLMQVKLGPISASFGPELAEMGSNLGRIRSG